MALTNSQHSQLMRLYEQKQLKSHDIQDRRLSEIYQKIPAYRALDQELSSYAIKAAKMRVLDPNFRDNSHEKIQAIIEEKKQLLITGGFPADYTEPIYECPDCKDTGYIGSQKCHCLKAAIIELLYAQSHISEILESENFDHFSFDYYSSNFVDPKTGLSSLETIRHAYQVCREFTDSFDREFENILLYGDTGIGKTFLSNCIAKELIESSHSVLYFSASELFSELADTHFQRTAEDEESLTDFVFDCDLLIIDDLGTELVNSFVVSQLFLCLNERILRKKSTIISTNLSLSTLRDTYSERILSRITSNYKMIKLIGDDIRIKKKLRNMED